jgi:hypothetical protein
MRVVLVHNNAKLLPVIVIVQVSKCYLRRKASMANDYDTIYLGTKEYGSEVMEEIAKQYFVDHANCDFVMVYEHGGWYLGYRRDLTIWCTANDAGILTHPTPQPTHFSGNSVRRD